MRPSIRKNLDKMREQAFQRFADEFGVTVEAVRNAASQAGLTSSEHTMNCIFSEGEEEMLVCACLIYVRQGTPFTIPCLQNWLEKLQKKMKITFYRVIL